MSASRSLKRTGCRPVTSMLSGRNPSGRRHKRFAAGCWTLAKLAHNRRHRCAINLLTAPNRRHTWGTAVVRVRRTQLVLNLHHAEVRDNAATRGKAAARSRRKVVVASSEVQCPCGWERSDQRHDRQDQKKRESSHDILLWKYLPIRPEQKAK